MDQQVVVRIAEKIKAARAEKRMTLQQVSDITKLSKGLLSKVENSRTIPSLPVLIRLVHGLGLSLKDFFHDMATFNGQSYIHLRPTDYVPIRKEDRVGFDYLQIFAHNIPFSTMEAVLLTIHPGAKGPATTTDGYEFKYVLSGSCDYYIDKVRLRMEEGDSLLFDASLPHRPVNPSRKKVIMLVFYFLV